MVQMEVLWGNLDRILLYLYNFLSVSLLKLDIFHTTVPGIIIMIPKFFCNSGCSKLTRFMKNISPFLWVQVVILLSGSQVWQRVFQYCCIHCHTPRFMVFYIHYAQCQPFTPLSCNTLPNPEVISLSEILFYILLCDLLII